MGTVFIHVLLYNFCQHKPYVTDQTISSDGEQVCFQLQRITPVLPNHHRQASTHRPLPPQAGVHSSSSTATGEASTHRPLPPQAGVHSSSSTTAARHPLIILYRHRQTSTHRPLPPQADVHSSSSTATDETSTHRPLLLGRGPALDISHSIKPFLLTGAGVFSASENNPSAAKPPQTRRPLIVLYRHRQASTRRPLPPQTDVHSSSSTATGRRPLIVLYRHRRDVHSSSSTATDRRPLIVLYRHRQASTHRPLPPQTRRPLIVLYCLAVDLHWTFLTLTNLMKQIKLFLLTGAGVFPASEPNPSADKPPQTRRPLIILYRHRRDVHSSSSTATDETSTHRPLPPQTRRPLIILYRHRRDVHSSSPKAF
ncbi:hypothetical protein HF521_016826 [Silurus meridionalis]|uniref:Uncharacterized protein n=1 Tax=Silurus meridionalis TaxID=175797 RepID=A0A8T0BWV6_SILME|nr:hypothetical protein HF521_016826 [Silurus meridionalis]